MAELNDMDLVRDYQHNSESAFAELVRRHINLVYSVAMRYVGNSQDAQDVTQAVFIILAKKAACLRDKTILAGWLYETTRFTATNSLRSKIRRESREQEAYMQSTLNDSETASVWQQVAPHLESAMTRLSEKERTLLALHFFENKSGAETAAALGIEEWAARKRVARAVEKLRKFFAQRGIGISAGVLMGAMTASSAQAAPTALATSISAVAISKGALATGSTLTLVKGALKIMAWIKIKTAIVLSLGVVLVAGSTAVTVATIGAHAEDEAIWTDWNALRKAPSMLLLRPTKFPSKRAGAEETHDGRFRARGMFSKWLLAFAYDSDDLRTILPADFPERNFDLLFTLPKNRKQALRDEIKKQLGLVAHKEIRETDVLVLKVKKTDAPGIRVSAGKESNWKSEPYKYDHTNQPIAYLVDYLGSRFGKVVIDRTGLLETYDIVLQWKPTLDGKAENEEIKQALLDQLGLELVPAKEPIEMLIVERVKN